MSVPFIEKLNGIAIVKIFQGNQCYTMQLKITNNYAVMDMVNNSKQTMYFRKEKALGIVDIRSLGYYNIRHSVLEYNLGEHCEFASFNKLATVYEDMKLAKKKPNKAERRSKEKEKKKS